jgi:hypothetical protein
MAFAPATLAGFDPGDESHPPHLAEYFLGLFGPQGPLPLHLTEYAANASGLWRPHLFPLCRCVPSPDVEPVLPGVGKCPANGEF